MQFAKPLLASFFMVALAAIVAPSVDQDQAVALMRTFKSEPVDLKFKATHAESYTIEGDPKSSLKYHGDAMFAASVNAAAEAGAFAVRPTFGAFSTSWWEGGAKEPFQANTVSGPAKVTFKETARLLNDRVLDAPTGFPDTLGADWYSSTESLARRVARALSAADGPFALQTRLNFAFPPLPPGPVAKGARFDADYVAGYFGREAQVQVFYASVVDSVNDKTVVLKQSGAAQLVKFPQPASRRSDGLTFEVLQDRSTFAATVEISRADGAVKQRDGELTVVVKATDSTKPAQPPVFVTAKIWTKLERQGD